MVVPKRDEPDLLEGYAGVARRSGPDARGGVAGIRTGDEPECQPKTARERKKVLTQGHGGVVDPVPILHDEEDRLAPGQPLEQLAQAEKDLAPQRLRVEELHPLLVLPRHFQREHSGDVGHDLGSAGIEQLARRLLELPPDLRLGVGVLDPETPLQDLDERPVAQVAPERERAALEPEQALGAAPTSGFSDQPRLAHAGFPPQDHHPAAALSQSLQGGAQDRQLPISADEGGADTCRPDRGPAGTGGPHSEQVIDVRWRGNPLERTLSERLELEEGQCGAMGGLACPDRAGLGVLLKPRGKIRGVSDRGVVHAQVVADLADHHHPRVDPHAHADLAQRHHPLGGVPQPLLNAGGGQQSAPSVILVRNGRPEQRHESIAKELIDGAFVAMHFRERQLEEAIQQPVHGLGPNARGKLGRIGDIAEHHGDQLALALERGARGQDPLGEMRGRIGGRGRGQTLRGGSGAQRRAAFPAELLRVGIIVRTGAALCHPHPFSRTRSLRQLRPGYQTIVDAVPITCNPSRSIPPEPVAASERV